MITQRELSTALRVQNDLRTEEEKLKRELDLIKQKFAEKINKLNSRLTEIKNEFQERLEDGETVARGKHNAWLSEVQLKISIPWKQECLKLVDDPEEFEETLRKEYERDPKIVVEIV